MNEDLEEERELYVEKKSKHFIESKIWLPGIFLLLFEVKFFIITYYL